MTNDHHAVIADFGFGTVISDNSLTFANSRELEGGSGRWMAPELLYPTNYGFIHCIPSKKGDIYAVGMVIYEVCYRLGCLMIFHLRITR